LFVNKALIIFISPKSRYIILMPLTRNYNEQLKESNNKRLELLESELNLTRQQAIDFLLDYYDLVDVDILTRRVRVLLKSEASNIVTLTKLKVLSIYLNSIFRF
jgi:hypothetical protein